jgi:hypothetical protein
MRPLLLRKDDEPINFTFGHSNVGDRIKLTTGSLNCWVTILCQVGIPSHSRKEDQAGP